MLTLLLVVVVVVSCWHCQWWWWWCGKAGSSQQLLLTTGALSTEENLQCSEDTECNHCSTECNALSREERWKLRQPKNESCALPARSQPFTSSGGRLSHFWQREILPKKLQIGIPPYRHYYENFCATRPKMVFCHKSHLVLAKKLTDLLGVLFTDKMFSKERFTIASHKFLQQWHKHWNHLHLLRYYTFAATIVTIIIRDARIYQFCSFLTLHLTFAGKFLPFLCLYHRPIGILQIF